MKKYQWGMISLGVLIFVVLIAFIFWYGRGLNSNLPILSLDTPAINQLPEKRCVEDTAFMRTNHMKLLVNWRDGVVRDGNRFYKAKDGKVYEMSLSGTCLTCHSNKEQFCDRCHNYVRSQPTCYSCHNIPGEVKK